MLQPLVSVMMPVYNTGRYVGAAIQSILNQTYTNLELIIINDGSTDNSEEAILSFNDPRIKYHPNSENKKIVYCRNKAIELAEGKYLAFMDSDDISHAQRLEKQIAFLEANPAFGLIGTYVQTIDGAGNAIGGPTEYPATTDELPVKLLFSNYYCTSSVTLLRDTLGDIRFDSNFPVAEDYVVWLAILKKGYKLAHIREVLTYYRVHEFNICRVENTLLLEKDKEILRMQLNSVGLTYSPEAFHFYFLYGKIDYEDYSNEFYAFPFEEVDSHFSALIAANNVNGVYNKGVLLSVLYRHWAMFFAGITAYNITLYKMVVKSPFYNLLPFDVKAKFFIKCVIKRGN